MTTLDRWKPAPAWLVLGLGVLVCVSLQSPRRALADDPASDEARRPLDEENLRFWLRNMLEFHRYSIAEAAKATGLAPGEITADVQRFGLVPGRVPPRVPGSALRVLPYPGGRHPRIGFLEGAVRPQRETKFSVFTPWDDAGYVVVDLPEALWSNLGLTYLAHTHVPTVWSRKGIELPRQEWVRKPGGQLESERRLPNGIVFVARVAPRTDSVRMSLSLTNGSDTTLTDLRVQMCVMLKGAPGFAAQTNENKTFRPPYALCRSDDGLRWVISAWSPCQRAWGNPPCPCLHSDPKFPDLPPGATRTVRGWLSFYEGKDIEAELRRIGATGWQAGTD